MNLNTDAAHPASVVNPTAEPRCQVLVIDDEAEVLNTLNRQLRREFDTFLAHNTREALSILRDRPIQVVISDERMPGMTGSEFFSQIQQQYPEAIRLLLTGYADLQAVIQAINQGHIYRYITKPWDATEIRTIVRDAYQRYQMTARNQRLLEALQEANDQLEQRVRERTEQLERALLELRDSEQLYRSIVENISDPVMVTDVQARILSVNPAFIRVTGYSAAEVIGHHPNMLASDRHPDKFYTEIWRRLLENGRWRGHVWNRRKNGEAYVQRLIISTLCEGASEGLCVAVYNDFTEEMEELEQVRFMAQHDALTGLPNRILLLDRLSKAIHDAHRQNCRVGVLFIDLNEFKPINDRHGHEAGDVVLHAFARRLEQIVRESDTVARLGGDEFVVVLRQISRLEHAKQVARKITDHLKAPFQYKALELFLTASIGIALYPDDGEDGYELLKRADAAMYAAKSGEGLS